MGTGSISSQKRVGVLNPNECKTKLTEFGEYSCPSGVLTLFKNWQSGKTPNTDNQIGMTLGVNFRCSIEGRVSQLPDFYGRIEAVIGAPIEWVRGVRW
jgi:hypothetical protein